MQNGRKKDLLKWEEKEKKCVQKDKEMWGSPLGSVANVLDNDIVVSEFEL